MFPNFHNNLSMSFLFFFNFHSIASVSQPVVKESDRLTSRSGNKVAVLRETHNYAMTFFQYFKNCGTSWELNQIGQHVPAHVQHMLIQELYAILWKTVHSLMRKKVRLYLTALVDTRVNKRCWAQNTLLTVGQSSVCVCVVSGAKSIFGFVVDVYACQAVVMHSFRFPTSTSVPIREKECF